MSLYFAYGSNLDQAQMTKRCPEHKLIGKAVLKDYKLAFTIFSNIRNCGCADVIKSPGDEVWGLVYELTPSDLDRLDEAEKHPNKYKRFPTEVIMDSGEKVVSVDVYEVVSKEGEHLEPSQDYYGIIVNAAEKYNFPDSYKKFLRKFKVLDK